MAWDAVLVLHEWVDHTHFYADDGICNELGYTGISRGRHTNHFYLPASRDEVGKVAAEPLRELELGLAGSHAKSAAIDHGQPRVDLGIDL